MSKAIVRKDKKNNNSYKLTLDLTRGELLSLQEALKVKALMRLSEGSPCIANDILCYVNNALCAADINLNA